jgi:hypothetical protein
MPGGVGGASVRQIYYLTDYLPEIVNDPGTFKTLLQQLFNEEHSKETRQRIC